MALARPPRAMACVPASLRCARVWARVRPRAPCHCLWAHWVDDEAFDDETFEAAATLPLAYLPSWTVGSVVSLMAAGSVRTYLGTYIRKGGLVAMAATAARLAWSTLRHQVARGSCDVCRVT